LFEIFQSKIMAVRFFDICKLYVSKNDIMDAIEKSLSFGFEDNLRTRHINVKFDSKVRGYLGEKALTNWLKRFGITPQKSNHFNAKTFMDVDLEFMVDHKKVSAEVKTSLIPDTDKRIKTSIKKRDIKLIKRGEKTIEQLEADLHIQLYYRQLSIAKDTWLKKQKLNFNTSNLEDLYFKSASFRYLNDIFFVGWVSKNDLIRFHTPKEKVWTFPKSKRVFWECNIEKSARPPLEIVSYLKGNAKT